MSARSSAVGELRHTFRTPVNHIVGYTEMLLEDLPPGDEEHREPLKEILAAAHDALSHISAVLVPSDVPATEAVRRLYDELEEPQARIMRAVSSLITAHDLGEAAADDLRRILNAAEQLRPKDLELTVPAAAAEEEPEAERPSRILVVDDVEDNRQLLRRRLEKQGYAVSCAEDGKKALAMVESDDPDLILLDIMMPELDGFAVLERLKANKHTRDIPVIVDLGARRHGERGAMHRAGGGGFPPEAVRSGAAQGARGREPREEARARPGACGGARGRGGGDGGGRGGDGHVSRGLALRGGEAARRGGASRARVQCHGHERPRARAAAARTRARAQERHRQGARERDEDHRLDGGRDDADGRADRESLRDRSPRSAAAAWARCTAFATANWARRSRSRRCAGTACWMKE